MDRGFWLLNTTTPSIDRQKCIEYALTYRSPQYGQNMPLHACLIGSMRNYDHILNLAKDLQDAGHTVSVPVDLSERRFSDRVKMKAEFMKNMFETIQNCDSILVVNDVDREGYKGYIGPNTFLQLGLGFSLGKTLYCLEDWDTRLPYNEELEAMQLRKLDIKLPH